MPPKKDFAEDLLGKGSVFLHLDPRQKGVRVPKWLRYDPQLVLQVGFEMPIPITDLAVDDKGVSATLTFQRSPHFCSVPWDAVFAVVGEDGRGMLWPEDLPQELFNEVAREAARDGFDGGLGSLLEDFEDDYGALDAPSEIRSNVAERPLRLVSDAPAAKATKAKDGAGAAKKSRAKKAANGETATASGHSDSEAPPAAAAAGGGRQSRREMLGPSPQPAARPAAQDADAEEEVVQPLVRGRALPSYMRVVK